MAQRIGYLVAGVADDPRRVAEACLMLRHVASSHVTPDGDVLCMLERDLRDEHEGFGFMERAIRALKGVTRVEGHAFPLSFGRDWPHAELEAAVREAIDRTRPTVPGRDEDHGGFAATMRAWTRTAAALQDALAGIAPAHPQPRD